MKKTSEDDVYKQLPGRRFDEETEANPNKPIDLTFHGRRIEFQHTRSSIIRNPGAAKCYELGLAEKGHPLYSSQTRISSTGALVARSGRCTGRVPKDKRVVEEDVTKDKVWWGPVNYPMPERDYKITRVRAIDFLNTRPNLYIVDGFANWDPKNRIKVRVICSTAYHALFMENMLVRPTAEELRDFVKPDFFIYNAGEFTQGRVLMGRESNGCIALNLKEMEMVILGTCYAGEMKKGVFTLMNYLMPERGLLSMHASANVGPNGDSTVFFGLSGTGKTTLSAESTRNLIGDDEIVWGPDGLSNIEGGCYAKAINLSAEKEPEIWDAIRFGCVLENVGFHDDVTNEVDYSDTSITENTRACYPIEHISNCVVPCLGPHAKNVIFLACDAFGVLPPVAKLTKEQAMFHFLSGYTAKVAGTEVGIKEPKETFSACFGEAFLVHHPSKYCSLLKEKIEEHGADVWLVNTGWVKGPYGSGERISLKHTRAIINAIHNGDLKEVNYKKLPIFNLDVPTEVKGVPSDILMPQDCWEDQGAYMEMLSSLAKKFMDNYSNYEGQCPEDIRLGGPTLASVSGSASSGGHAVGLRNYHTPRSMPIHRAGIWKGRYTSTGRYAGPVLNARRWTSSQNWLNSAKAARFLKGTVRKFRP